MTRIVKLKVAGVESVDREIDLPPRAVFAGGVGSGKSAAVNSVRLAALGYVPHLGRTEAASARMVRRGEADVEVTLDDGRSFGVHLTNGVSGSGRDPRLSWDDELRTVRAKGDAIRSLFGASQAEAEEHLDLRSLVNTPPGNRAKVINDMLAASAGDELRTAKVVLFASLRALRTPFDRVATPPDAAVEAMAASQAAMLDEATRAALYAAVDSDGFQGFENWADAQEHAAKVKNVQARAAREAEVALQELERRLAEIDVPAGLTLADARAQLAKRREQLAAANEAITRWRDAVARVAALRARLEALDPGERPDPGLLEQQRDDLASARARLVAVRGSRPAKPTPPDQADYKPHPELMEAAEAAATRAHQVVESRPLAPVPPAAPSDEHIVRLATKFVRDLEAFDVPTADLKEWMDRFEAAVEPLRRTVLERLDHSEAMQEYELAKARHEQAVTAWRKAVESVEEEMALAKRAVEEEVQARWRKDYVAFQEADIVWDRAVAEHAEKVRGVEGAIHALSSSIEAAERQARAYEKAQEERARMESEVERLAPATVESVREDAERAAAEVETALPGLEAAYEALVAQAEVQDAVAQATERVESCRSKEAAFSAIEVAVKELRNRDLQDRTAPLVAAMRAFLDEAGWVRAPYVDLSRGKCDFGWVDGTTRVSVETMSGGETVVFMTALAVAVLKMRRPQVSALIVEAAELGDTAALAGLLDALASDACAHVDNVLVATCYSRVHEVAAGAGFEVINF